MDKQTKRDYLYMRMARTWSENSYCVRRKVGAILVKNQMIISDGYNGTPSGFENVCEEDNVSKPYVLPAEANALTKVARSHNSSDGATHVLQFDGRLLASVRGMYGTGGYSIGVLQSKGVGTQETTTYLSRRSGAGFW